MSIIKITIIYFVLCFIDSFIIRNIKKHFLYKKAVEKAKKENKKLIVLGSPHLSLSSGGVVGYITEKIILGFKLPINTFNSSRNCSI